MKTTPLEFNRREVMGTSQYFPKNVFARAVTMLTGNSCLAVSELLVLCSAGFDVMINGIDVKQFEPGDFDDGEKVAK